MRKTKWALGLIAAAAIGCGDGSDQDKYQGVVDQTPFDAKFKSTCSGTNVTTCTYAAKVAWANDRFFTLYDFGTLPGQATPTTGVPLAGIRPFLPASYAAANTFVEFPDGCRGTDSYDRRTESFPRTTQWPVVQALPLASTTKAVHPLVTVRRWTGTGDLECQAIKNAKHLLEDGDFPGQLAEDTRLAVRAVIDPVAALPALSATSSFTSVGGWYKGLQLAWLDGGAVSTDDAGNVKTMDAVFVQRPSSGAAGDDTDMLLTQYAPGDEGWSPVVVLRNYRVATGQRADQYKKLCYDPPCATGFNMATPPNGTTTCGRFSMACATS